MEQEKLPLIATVEDLLRYEIALREPADDGLHLIFPSQLTRENSSLPDPEGKVVTFAFEGALVNVYATLAVTLSHSGLYKKKEMWKNAVAYTAISGGTCGMFLREIEEGRGNLTLFFDKASSEQRRFHFEEYVRIHLEPRALPESIFRSRIFSCSNCQTPISELQVAKRCERGLNWIRCNVCDERVSLLDHKERLTVLPEAGVEEMDRFADAKRQQETAVSILQGKVATNDFDVFLCHNSADKPAVKKVGETLKERGILPWLDEWELAPGRS